MVIRYIFEICADGLLYKMVRNIVRAIVKAGEGRYTRDDLRRILEEKDGRGLLRHQGCIWKKSITCTMK